MLKLNLIVANIWQQLSIKLVMRNAAIMSDVVQKRLIGRQNVSLLASFYAGLHRHMRSVICFTEIVLTCALNYKLNSIKFHGKLNLIVADIWQQLSIKLVMRECNEK